VAPPLLRALALVAALVALVALPGTAAAAAGSGGFRVRSGVVYGTGTVDSPTPGGTTNLLLDLYQPTAKATGRRPVVVLIHGGGFLGQSRKDAGIVRIARGLAGEGIVVASIDYRLIPTDPVPSQRVAPLFNALPPSDLSSGIAAAVDDALTATDYLKAHAKQLNIDMSDLGLIGASAGGITADHVAYALGAYGIPAPQAKFVGSLWGGILVPAPPSVGDTGADMLGPGAPALFSVHGDADTVVPTALDDQLVARAQQEGVRNVYYRVPGGTHGFTGAQFFSRKVSGNQTAYDRLLLFAQQLLRPAG
jgi:acetyl esterase/lipase